MKYKIGVKEVWEQMYEVEASSKEEALMKLENDMFFGTEEEDDIMVDNNAFEFSHTLEKDEWAVYD